jgi:hypothetical protein
MFFGGEMTATAIGNYPMYRWGDYNITANLFEYFSNCQIQNASVNTISWYNNGNQRIAIGGSFTQVNNSPWYYVVEYDFTFSTTLVVGSTQTDFNGEVRSVAWYPSSAIVLLAGDFNFSGYNFLSYYNGGSPSGLFPGTYAQSQPNGFVFYNVSTASIVVGTANASANFWLDSSDVWDAGLGTIVPKGFGYIGGALPTYVMLDQANGVLWKLIFTTVNVANFTGGLTYGGTSAYTKITFADKDYALNLFASGGKWQLPAFGLASGVSLS